MEINFFSENFKEISPYFVLDLIFDFIFNLINFQLIFNFINFPISIKVIFR